MPTAVTPGPSVAPPPLPPASAAVPPTQGHAKKARPDAEPATAPAAGTDAADGSPPAASQPRPSFGSRRLVDKAAVWENNAWDHVTWEAEEEAAARAVVAQQAQAAVPAGRQAELEQTAADQWNAFYGRNGVNFFKDRQWLANEFPEIFDSDAAPAGQAASDAAPPIVTKRILEIGCGVGNTIFPILERNQDPGLHVYATDYSATAISLLKEHALYKPSRCTACVFDVTSPDIPPCLKPGSMDIIICIFVLSAISPATWPQAAANIQALLKPGGLLLFRDYGRHDLAQLRFKKDRYLAENFYVRGDNTRVYFFTQDEIAAMFPGWEVMQNDYDRRLIVNRKRAITMHRNWLQTKLRKPR
ncbi:hypothetical protein CXG81DRAFT_13361 [Caulochytrium protostelioides]|uniref:tRNA N(3)-methylcytidine methyltransferase n=1 Tax=Caulochytrium protostelioides TaxID=1555241 RepID=A0A4P9X280_9FUNG|nr:methyltransferase [Caulochytrium protostelioides]RKP00315.1 hypothetical protein CXG81DRAFT_13361 [Caulochytrium protostelioides]|eukprot:RKP00315.1 hypothetical protein CXG81DRAFT_13361 [Caulochytrium protostelioides]